MSAPARLVGLRLQGFKSFAERTNVEFGPGISAIVGPNGAGKSNLADALRWALGEQGRSLRTRRAEDVIWAGSERRAALGMADVTLVLDNADGLLSTEYSLLELGRRLYRSGENDYLLNRQRVRLRDLVDLLDSAHLADNAFLFIGQGMVDQALALRPEERRPLFEEVAGVRRHERKKRRSEEQLLESEANLARVEDILAELRPQARRLAAQAQQQASRLTASEELADGLLLAAHARWHSAAARVAEATTARERAHEEATRAMAELAAAEASAAAIGAELGARAQAEAERRVAHETARSDLTSVQLADARRAAETEALARERIRLDDERAAAEIDLARQRRLLGATPPEQDLDLEHELAAAESAVAEALAEVATLQAATRACGEEALAMRRATAAREAEAETARRRLADAARRHAAESERAAAAEARRMDLEAGARAAHEAIAETESAESATREDLEAARLRLAAGEAARAAAADRAAAASAGLSGLRGRLESLEAHLAEDESRGIARAARRHGGRRLDANLVVDPGLRPAVERALADAARAYLVGRDVVPELSSERGTLVVEEIGGGNPRARGATPMGSGRSTAERQVAERIAAMGGGLLPDAVGNDPTAAVRRLLARSAWLPTLEACLELQSSLPAGWSLVTRDGSALVTDLTVTLGPAEGLLERRGEATRLAAEIETLAKRAAELQRGADEASGEVAAVHLAFERMRESAGEAASNRRIAEDAERVAARELEAAVRDSEWLRATADRLASEVERIRTSLLELEPAPSAPGRGAADASGKPPPESALESWQARVAELRAGRDRLAAEVADRHAARRQAEADRARAEAALGLDAERLATVDREFERLAARERDLEALRDTGRRQIAEAVQRENDARIALEELLAADAADRGRLSAAEKNAAEARERLRTADGRARAVEQSDLGARLGLDALREQVLVELAGLGEVGLRRLGSATAVSSVATGTAAAERGDDADDADDAVALESALDAVVDRWTSNPPPAEPPSPGRLASLRRRFHELGAPNPYAVEEYSALKERLETLEAQEADLRHGIARTRQLIEELNAMIADQFRSTFQALEVAFDTRFRQLFGGGFARLSMTDPTDLAATGIEIVARPPGKKPQALAMLSGGERALTAVALLFAMLAVRPVPFCVLDEVDAALDEANVGRFTDALRDLAERTQFVIITHNRGTIESADALYGVTVGDDSVSRVVSLRIEEAQAIAERRRAVALADAPLAGPGR